MKKGIEFKLFVNGMMELWTHVS